MRKVESSVGLTAATITPEGGLGTVLLTRVQLMASTDGLFDSDIDRVKIIKGRAADPTKLDEVVMSPVAAALFHLHVGSHLLVGIDTNTQRNLLPPHRKLDLRIVGEGVLNFQVIQDDIDRGRTGFLLGTRALAREFSKCCASVGFDGLALTPGSDPTVVEHEYAQLVSTSPIPSAQGQLLVYVASTIEADAQRSIRPEATAFGVFGLVAFVATLLIAGQAIARSLRSGAVEVEVLRALGAGPVLTSIDGLPGVAGAVLAGALLSVALAIALSPYTLFGPVRTVDPSPGVYLDWTVLGLGALVLLVLLVAVGVVVAYRQAPHRVALRERRPERAGRVVRTAVASGLPTPAVIGLRFALDPGRERTTAPVRSAIAGAVLATLIVSATLVFGASLSTLVSHPALYGWNFDAALYSTDGFGPIPSDLTHRLLSADPDVRAFSGAYFTTGEVDHETVPVIAIPPGAAINPPILTGTIIHAPHEIVLGRETLTRLHHKRIGDHVTMSSAGIPPVRLRIVGTAALPAIGQTLGEHASMSRGAVISTADVPASLLTFGAPPSFAKLLGPNALFVRFRPGVDRAAAQQGLARIARAVLALYHTPAVAQVFGSQAQYGLDINVLPVQRPAEIVNYRSMGTTPSVLAGALAAGVLVALALTLLASVRRCRRELALLKTLGFTRRQLYSAVAWQATAIGIVGVVCQWSAGCPRWRPRGFPMDGHEDSPGAVRVFPGVVMFSCGSRGASPPCR
ncbi:MAG: FtsX-like permease family protein [Acidimicrobiia bacterium]